VNSEKHLRLFSLKKYLEFFELLMQKLLKLFVSTFVGEDNGQNTADRTSFHNH